MRYFYLIFIPLMFLLVSCGNKKSSKQAFDPTIPVEIQVLGETEVSNYRNYVGTVQSEMTISLSFPLGGTLKGIYVHNGQRVRKGDLIARVDETSAKSLHDAAMATLSQAEDGYKRLKQVHEGGGISDVRWVQMETDLEKARQTEISTRRNLQECTIYAPQSGCVSMDTHVIGERLSPGMVVCQIVDMNHMMVEFTAPEKEIGLINIGDQATATIPALNDVKKTLVIVDKAFLSNPLGHSYTIKAKFVEPDKDVLPGMVTKIQLALQDDQASSLVVPSSCVITMPDGMAVWVLRQGKAFRQQIKVSEFVKNGVQVSEGLQLGDTIVVAGYQKLYNGAQVSF